jgi:hypothetical protein
MGTNYETIRVKSIRELSGEARAQELLHLRDMVARPDPITHVMLSDFISPSDNRRALPEVCGVAFDGRSLSAGPRLQASLLVSTSCTSSRELTIEIYEGGTIKIPALSGSNHHPRSGMLALPRSTVSPSSSILIG